MLTETYFDLFICLLKLSPTKKSTIQITIIHCFLHPRLEHMKKTFANNGAKLWIGLPGSMNQTGDKKCHPSNESYQRLGSTGTGGVLFRCAVHRMPFYSYYFCVWLLCKTVS